MNNPIIIFDGVCILCNKSVQFILQHDRNAYFRFASFQSKYGEEIVNQFGLLPGKPASLLLVENKELFNKSTAALKIARKLNGLWPLFYVLIIIPKSIRDFFYDLIANNRYKLFGKRDHCMIPGSDYQDRFIP